ncbi:MAG: xanthine dehydrogenase family protein molybdopterin-binding subunit [Clostridiales bacterium]|nr:xanthine dehydrogenase family protein molybdopterin-binding subunit [Clostridiales bacterium]
MSSIEYRHIGKNAQRVDAVDIVTGGATFVNDYKMKDLLYAKALRSSHAHARIKKIDISKAEALEGVRAVLYYGNIPKECEGWGLSTPPAVPVLGREASYVGDAVALVAAETEQIAEMACDLIEIEYEVLPAVFSTVDAVKPDAPVVHEEFESNILPNVPFIGEDMMDHLVRGDVEKAFAECDIIVEGENEYNSLGCPMAMEPPCVIMTYEETRMKAWASTQVAKMFGNSCTSRMRGMPVDTTVFNVGGGFGNKASMQCTTMYSALLAVATRQPVKMNMTKTEQLLVHDQRIGMYLKCRLGLKDGIVHAVQGTCYLDCGSYNDCGQWQMGVGLGECQVAFGKCQNWDIEGKLVMTNHVQTGAVRGFGGQEIKATLMPLAMQAVEKAGIDPVEFCMKNFAQTGDGWYWRERKWYDCREQDYVPAMEAAAEKFRWKDRWKGWNQPTSVNGSKATGVGVSVHGNADVGEDASEAYVRFEPITGNVYLHAGLAEQGNGERSNLRKFAAEVLDMPLEKVYVTPLNSESNPMDAGPIGSRCTLTLGTAVTRAAEDALEQILKLAADTLHASPHDLRFHDGMVYYKNRPQEPHHPMEFIPFGSSITGFGRYLSNYSKSNFNIYFCEVEVDRETGETKLLDVLVGTDVGQIIDPRALNMQVHGGFGAAAADTGLMDENVLDRPSGHVMTGNMIDYKWRTFNDFPPIDSVILESLPEISRFKATGFGEISGAPGPAAMMMAISNAIGVDYCEYPASREGILKALGKL